MECKLIINNGLFRAEVHFRGGSIMAKARRPASYATSRFIEQDIIENSAEYKSGKIVLLHEVEVPDDAEEMARKASLSAAKQPKTTEESEKPATETTEEQPHEDATDESSDGAADDGDVQTIEVACKADAVEWLKEHYPEKGYNGNTLRSKEAFAAACKEAGVEFKMAE